MFFIFENGESPMTPFKGPSRKLGILEKMVPILFSLDFLYFDSFIYKYIHYYLEYGPRDPLYLILYKIIIRIIYHVFHIENRYIVKH